MKNKLIYVIIFLFVILIGITIYKYKVYDKNENKHYFIPMMPSNIRLPRVKVTSDVKEEEKDNTVDENIRYYGSNPNNYVSFNNELWRIIGVFGDNVKLVRKDSLGELSWDSSESSVNNGWGVNEWSQSALKNYAKTTAAAIASLAEKIYSLKGDSLVIVSLARAGTPIGVLIKRYLEKKYCVQLTHYSISIIRGRGIDKNALDYILARHNAESVQFVDGWIGKGAILGELVKELRDYPQLSSDRAVVSDPANLTDLCGTHEDFLIPSSCLNATVTGLISRTFLRHDIIGKTDFHGAAFLGELTDSDLTEEYLTAIEREFDYSATNHVWAKGLSGVEVVKKIANTYAIDDINFIKPGIGETTRVLLRRIPWKVLVNPKHNGADELQHIIQLAHDKGVPVELSSVDLGNYKVCGIIKNLADM